MSTPRGGRQLRRREREARPVCGRAAEAALPDTTDVTEILRDGFLSQLYEVSKFAGHGEHVSD
ncbi:hypothetical protein GCM10007925_12580 [Sphingomonas astaxanthinifaciens DSM 22298]|uniref:Uncharacterized protein n=1 Tax=Sphingomonas astaxanthinifaciens DSM 22298 TaxID=1123267 RepID=A0ABQ5Z7N6_9SPHN|nr:hypothetical protein GCM10007925_12580 [Sphingomonas astaxanthinifaciens DSM 22298]